MDRGLGVEKRASSIRLAFTDQHGQRQCETLKVGGTSLKPTAANLAYANRLAATIRREVALGTFNMAEHFPHSTKADAAQAHTFGPLADAWLQSKSHLADATRDQYRLAVNIWKQMLGAGTPVQQLTHEVLAKKIGAHFWPSAKRRNNCLIALRGVMGLHFVGRKALDNPTGGIVNARVVKKLPDPLSMAERDAILADMRSHYDERITAYFTFAFFAGMRPEEIIALRWEDIDWRPGAEVARVQRVRTFKGAERDGTKTGTGRDVELMPEAVQALRTMKPHTFLKRDDQGAPADVFENPVTGRAWHDERSQREHYWQPTLKRLGIRMRRAYCTRHTYCTVGLMAGVKPAYIASQAGHSVLMLLSTYARWIPHADGGSERQRMAAAQGGGSAAEELRPMGRKG